MKKYNEEILTMAYNKKNQSDYNKKRKQFKVQYSLYDDIEGTRLQVYLEQTGQSANSYIKSLIKADLDAKGFNVDMDADA